MRRPARGVFDVQDETCASCRRAAVRVGTSADRSRTRPARAGRAGCRTSAGVGFAHGRAARSAAGADRALSRQSAGADPDGIDLSARGRRGEPLGHREQEAERRTAHQGGRCADLGRQRQVAGRDAVGARHDEQSAVLDAEARRRGAGTAVRRHGLGAAAARTRAGLEEASKPPRSRRFRSGPSRTSR